MCRYYAHTHTCGHTTTVLACQCSSAAITRRPCGKGEICATLKIEEGCAKCPKDEEDVGKELGLRKEVGRGFRKVRRG